MSLITQLDNQNPTISTDTSKQTDMRNFVQFTPIDIRPNHGVERNFIGKSVSIDNLNDLKLEKITTLPIVEDEMQKTPINKKEKVELDTGRQE